MSDLLIRRIGILLLIPVSSSGVLFGYRAGGSLICQRIASSFAAPLKAKRTYRKEWGAAGWRSLVPVRFVKL
ncbi:hypothetical protein B0J13DRAFT_541683 [Dactylonectria estremocensis]|uniref:Uncharacterized protein n=1 Tax=Dactylonectria estremocensis TaxID=1079267 RepID=A0A9P9F8Q5_9HYPO|nr:hypothetical protein B0J13DRAFT_541683 [Dactylonectria estremocensis]